MKKILIAVMTVPFLFSSALAATLDSPEDALMKAIVPLGSEVPDINVVTPAHLPVPSGSSGLGPGTQIIMDRPDGSFLCTANFIWSTTSSTTTSKGKSPAKKGKNTETTTTTTNYLGAAGHCFVPTDLAATHGPDADYDAAKTTVYACVAECDFGGQLGALTGDQSGLGVRGQWVQLGALAYARQTRSGVDLGQDFGIITIPSELSNQIRPSMPVWGGPSSIEEVTEGRTICVYGNAAGLGETLATKARAGVGRGINQSGTAWRAVLPSFQGDSGAAIVTCGPDSDGVHGQGAAGIVTHIGLANLNPTAIPNHTGHMHGTTMGQAVRMTLNDAGLSIKPVLEDNSTPSPTPPPSPAPDEEPGTLAMDGTYSWTAGPFTRTATTTALDDSCSAWREETPHCDYEYINVNVPQGGGTLGVTIETADPETSDFDLYVFDPDGQLVEQSASGGTPPEAISKVVWRAGLYTIAVTPYATEAASYTGTATLKAPPTPTSPPTAGPSFSGTPRIYQGGALDPFGAVGVYEVVPGTSVGLSVRSLKSNADSTVQLSLGNFTAFHQVTKDGQVVYGPWDAVVAADGAALRTDNDWDVPADAPTGEYQFEAWAVVNGFAYHVASLTFYIDVAL